MNNRILTSSSSSDSSDEDYLDPRRARIINVRENILERFDDVSFKMRFRIEKECAREILNLIGHHLEPLSGRNMPIPAMTQLLLTLRYYATGSFQICTGDIFMVSKASVSRIVTKVSHYIALLGRHFIQLPQAQNEKNTIHNQFYRISGFPGVLGAIDCTHIKIQSPGGNMAEMYRNRKGWFSINVQTVCDPTLKIMDIVAQWPGSVHDSTIFNQSAIRGRFEGGNLNNCYLLGDGGYACTRYLLTPLLNPTTNAERLYNEAHIRTRNVVERSYGIWKRRFPCLSLGMRMKIERILCIIVATAVIHNICIDMSDDEPAVDINVEVPLLLDPGNQLQHGANDNAATRRAIINTVFNQ